MTGRLVPCSECGEVFPVAHDCDLAREARATFDAAKRANNPESAKALCDKAYALALLAEIP